MEQNSSSIDKSSDKSVSAEMPTPQTEQRHASINEPASVSPLLKPKRQFTAPLRIQVALEACMKPQPTYKINNDLDQQSQEITGFYNHKPTPPVDTLEKALGKISPPFNPQK